MTSKMYQESSSAPSVIADQLSQDEECYRELGAYARADNPAFVTTIARGSSCYACYYGAYMITARLGVPVIPLSPSIVTLYQAPLKMQNSLALGVSQSGRSPDIVAVLEACSKAGAKTAAFVNVEDSPMAKLADIFCPLRSGPEFSVAATKTFIAGMTALARFVGHWGQDQALLDGLKSLPDVLEKAQKVNLNPIVELFHDKDCALVLGRGSSWSIALEAALKLKETCSLQAEAFSSAEVKHGPRALVGPGYPVLIFAPRGQAQKDIIATAKEMREFGASVLLITTAEAEGADLILPEAPDPWLDPLVMIQTFHLAVEQLARSRGMNPDHPPHLDKVTLTV
ncbi:MAG: SIS domain-containing protein [Holophagales bacterium]|nr:SIS domain-containing protein [Holophagales bacterium]